MKGVNLAEKLATFSEHFACLIGETFAAPVVADSAA